MCCGLDNAELGTGKEVKMSREEVLRLDRADA